MKAVRIADALVFANDSKDLFSLIEQIPEVPLTGVLKIKWRPVPLPMTEKDYGVLLAVLEQRGVPK